MISSEGEQWGHDQIYPDEWSQYHDHLTNDPNIINIIHDLLNHG